MSNATNLLGTMPVRKLLLKLAIPAILAQIINALYNIIDRIYIGNMPEVGSLALTGVGVTFPILSLISAFASFIGMGASPLLSMALGEKDHKKAHRILGTCTGSLIILAVILTAVFLVFNKPILMTFGASENTFPFASDYINIYLIGTIFVMFNLGLNPSINAQGFSKIGMITIIIGAVCNIILDPIFIFGLGLGVKGAALATIISQAISAVWVFSFLRGKKATITIKAKYIIPKMDTLFKITSLGISSFVMLSTNSLTSIVINSQLITYGNDYYVGAYTIINSVAQLVLMVVTGVTQGGQPILSYNYSAKRLDRVREAFKLVLFFCLLFDLIAWLAILFVPQYLIGIFNQEPDLLKIAIPALRTQMFFLVIMGIQSACQTCFLALGQAKTSLFLALERKVLLIIPLAFILPLIFGTPESIFFSQPIADVFAVSTTAFMFKRFYRNNLAENTVGV